MVERHFVLEAVEHYRINGGQSGSVRVGITPDALMANGVYVYRGAQRAACCCCIADQDTASSGTFCLFLFVLNDLIHNHGSVRLFCIIAMLCITISLSFSIITH